MSQDQDVHEHAFDNELVQNSSDTTTLQLDDLKEVHLTVAADLGHCDMYVREVLGLERGSVLPLNKLAGEMADVHVNGVPLAKGEIVVLGDSLNVRVAEIYGLAAEKEVHEQ